MSGDKEKNDDEEGLTRLDNWVHGSPVVQCTEQAALVTSKQKCNVYGEAIVAAGRAEWDIKIEFESFGGICLGLWRHDFKNKNDLGSLPLDDPFFKGPNGFAYNQKTGVFQTNGERKKYGRRFGRGDTLTIALDMTARTLSFLVNGETQGVAVDPVPRGYYRLAGKMQFKEQKISILRFWTSLTDHGITNYDKVAAPVGAILNTGDDDDKEDEDESGDPQTQDAPQMSNYRSVEDVQAELEAMDIGNGYAQDESVSGEEEEESSEEDEDEDDEDADEESEEREEPAVKAVIKTPIKTSTNEDEFDKAPIDKSDEEDAASTMSGIDAKSEDSYSVNEMREVIKHQRRTSGSIQELFHEEKTTPLGSPITGPRSANEETPIGALSLETITRVRGGSIADKVTPIVPVPPQVEIEKKAEDSSDDKFVHWGTQLNCNENGDVVTCIREQPGKRNSAFGAQVIRNGRMDWILKIIQGHSIRIGVSGVTNTTGVDFSTSDHGYGYGDDGNIYTKNSHIEFGNGFSSGDTVGVFLDMDKGTLRYQINDEDHGNVFEDLKIDEDEGVFGYRLAVSLCFRPHKIQLIESTMWETRQVSPRPMAINGTGPIKPRRLSWKAESLPTHSRANSSEDEIDQKKPIKKKKLKKSKKKKNGNGKKKTGGTAKKGKKSKGTRKKKNGKPSKKQSTRGGRSKKKEPGKKPPRKKKTGKTGGTKTGRSTRASQKRTKTKGKKPRTGRASKNPKPGRSAKKPATGRKYKKSTRVGGTSGASASSSKKRTGSKKKVSSNPSANVVWKERPNCRDKWDCAGNALSLDGPLINAKNGIKDANSAFGKIEIKTNMRVEWDVKITAGSSVALGIIKASASAMKSNSSKYGKLLNGFFSNDRQGFAYFGKDGSTQKGGKMKRYGEKFTKGDVITVRLDMVGKTLSFAKNGKDQGIAFKNIPVSRYRLAIMLPRKFHKAQIERVTVFDVDSS